jgi:hypothetical protein
MSFGYSVGDFLALTQLAWRVLQNSQKACGAHDELTGEVTRLHVVLQRLALEISNPESLLNRSNDNRREELADLSSDCNKVLRVLSNVLEKYNTLSDERRSLTKFYKKIRFGNGEMLDLGEIRLKVSTYTSAITILLNLLSIGSQGRVERYMDSHGEELREIRHSLNWITASLQAKSQEGSILTSYAEDDKAVWKDFRRELIKEGFHSSVLSRHKRLIRDYILELGSRGALDDIQNNEQDLRVKEEVQLHLTDPLTLEQSIAPASDEAITSNELVPGRLNEKGLAQSGLARTRRAQEKEKQVVKVPQDEPEALKKRRKQMNSAAKAGEESRDMQPPPFPVRPLNGEDEIELEAVSQHSIAALERAIADVQATQLLLSNGFDIDAALHWAAENGHEAVARQLLEEGADANAEDIWGLTALQWAAMYGHEAVARLLLEKGADACGDETYGLTALHTSAMNGHEAVARLLLEEGADANAEDIWGLTALQWAAMYGHEVAARLLLEKGADARGDETYRLMNRARGSGSAAAREGGER